MLLTRTYIIAGVLAVATAVIAQQRQVLRAETGRLQATHDTLAVAVADARLQREVDGIRLALERAREGATPATEPHLAMTITDGRLTLERGDIVLRSASAEADVTRGVRVITTVGPDGIEFEDGTRIHALDTPVRANSVRISTGDLAALLPNVRPGLVAYFH